MNSLATGLVSAAWSLASLSARKASQLGWLKSISLNARVISVGNLQVGGAGKTPLVARIANEAHQRGKTVCILTRGYGGAWEQKGGLISPRLKPASASACGDEAALLHWKCPEAWIGVGADRIRQYDLAVENHGRAFDWVILDDGFQHWKIKKDLEIVALTSYTPWQKIHRDFHRSLKFAQLLVWTKGETRPEVYGRPMIRVIYQIPKSKGEAFWLVSGVGDPEGLKRELVHAGYSIANSIAFKDHYSYDQQSVQDLLQQAQSGRCRILLTGKDWVKWRDFGVSMNEVTVIEPDVCFEEGYDLWLKTLWGESQK